MSHDEASLLLGAYALDAVDGEEHTQLEQHLANCPRCRAELDGMREVAAAIGNTVESPPEGLWSSIASRLPERTDEDEAPPMPRLVSGRRPDEKEERSGRSVRLSIASLGAVVVAAAAVIAVLGIGLSRADNQVSNLQSAAARNQMSYTVAGALRTPGHKLVDLNAGSHVQLAQFVVLPDGRGFLVSSRLPALGADRTYQLWGIAGKQPISLGLLGQSPGQAAFTMAGAVTVSRLSITTEPSGGSVTPNGPIVASGTV
jgi:anti-sigma-K factor RskA